MLCASRCSALQRGCGKRWCMQGRNTRLTGVRSGSMWQPWRRRFSVGLVRMMQSAVVLAEAWRPIGFREGTAMDELAGVPALTFSQLPRNAHLLDPASCIFGCLLTNPSASLCLCLSPYRKWRWECGGPYHRGHVGDEVEPRRPWRVAEARMPYPL